MPIARDYDDDESSNNPWIDGCPKLCACEECEWNEDCPMHDRQALEDAAADDEYHFNKDEDL